jgi:hypothetical protein
MRTPQHHHRQLIQPTLCLQRGHARVVSVLCDRTSESSPSLEGPIRGRPMPLELLEESDSVDQQETEVVGKGKGKGGNVLRRSKWISLLSIFVHQTRDLHMSFLLQRLLTILAVVTTRTLSLTSTPTTLTTPIQMTLSLKLKRTGWVMTMLPLAPLRNFPRP